MAGAKPFSSKAHREMWTRLLDLGKVSQEAFDAKTAATGDTPLPDRAEPVKPRVGASKAAAEAKINDRRY